MTKIMIDRDLLERLLYSNSPARFDATEYSAARAELFAILANTSQQGEVVKVVPDGYVVVPVELLEDLRDLAADAVESQRAAYAGYKKERLARMDKMVAEASALLASTGQEVKP